MTDFEFHSPGPNDNEKESSMVMKCPYCTAPAEKIPSDGLIRCPYCGCFYRIDNDDGPQEEPAVDTAPSITVLYDSSYSLTVKDMYLTVDDSQDYIMKDHDIIKIRLDRGEHILRFRSGARTKNIRVDLRSNVFIMVGWDAIKGNIKITKKENVRRRSDDCDDGHPVNITFVRSSMGTGVLLDVEAYIDGKFMCKLDRNDSATVSVPSGTHILEVRAFSYGSECQWIYAKDDLKIKIRLNLTNIGINVERQE